MTLFKQIQTHTFVWVPKLKILASMIQVQTGVLPAFSIELPRSYGNTLDKFSIWQFNLPFDCMYPINFNQRLLLETGTPLLIALFLVLLHWFTKAISSKERQEFLLIRQPTNAKDRQRRLSRAGKAVMLAALLAPLSGLVAVSSGLKRWVVMLFAGWSCMFGLLAGIMMHLHAVTHRGDEYLLSLGNRRLRFIRLSEANRTGTFIRKCMKRITKVLSFGAPDSEIAELKGDLRCLRYGYYASFSWALLTFGDFLSKDTFEGHTSQALGFLPLLQGIVFAVGAWIVAGIKFRISKVHPPSPWCCRQATSAEHRCTTS
jgi:hypothetical protein